MDLKLKRRFCIGSKERNKTSDWFQVEINSRMKSILVDRFSETVQYRNYSVQKWFETETIQYKNNSKRSDRNDSGQEFFKSGCNKFKKHGDFWEVDQFSKVMNRHQNDASMPRSMKAIRSWTNIKFERLDDVETNGQL